MSIMFLSVLWIVVCANGVLSTMLPELHLIKEFTFKYPYSCQPASSTYENSALFLTDDGACGDDNFFRVMLAGSDFGMLSDLGDVPLENMTAMRAFNYMDVSGGENTFINNIEVTEGHTYVVLLAKYEVRALITLRVDKYVKSGPATIRYAVKQYGIIDSVQEASGFSWNEPNH
jgi:hypothetical protein